jgi:hypothetical protein
MSIEETQILYGILSFGIAFFSYKIGYRDGAAAQRREHYRRWREREMRWREFDDT